MRRIAANYIFTVEGAALKNGIVELDDNGKILKVEDTNGKLKESSKLEFYNGIITPGFINTHCHIELSELKDKIPQGKGLPEFINKIFEYRNENTLENNDKAIDLQNSLMRNAGIVAVADISNTNASINVKRSSSIYYHTFCEVAGTKSNPDKIFNSLQELFNEFVNQDLSASIVPHAPYSVSSGLFNRIYEFAEKENSILSIHNQETESENQMFLNKTGTLVDTLEDLGVDLSNYKPAGSNSLESITKLLPRNNNIIFVHNTYSEYEDVRMASEYFKNSYWCLCPLSNLYIENKLPDLNIFKEFSNKVTLGTDSLASNTTLSIMEEMKVISNNSDISFSELLKWATINGAKALKLDNKFGSIKEGKTPGLNLVTDFDFENMCLAEKSKVKVLV
ncbi:MAG: amidohydrolase family protein [Bacteroidales bacterium]|nr:amidohydrolase family protein [Bacteroidales bacterium]